MKTQTLAAKIRSLFPLVPKREGWRSPEFVVMGCRVYRGKERFVAGYGHSRTYAHHMSGNVTDRIVGYGDSQESAIKMMEEKLQPLAASGSSSEEKP